VPITEPSLVELRALSTGTNRPTNACLTVNKLIISREEGERDGHRTNLGLQGKSSFISKETTEQGSYESR